MIKVLRNAVIIAIIVTTIAIGWLIYTKKQDSKAPISIQPPIISDFIVSPEHLLETYLNDLITPELEALTKTGRISAEEDKLYFLSTDSINSIANDSVKEEDREGFKNYVNKCIRITSGKYIIPNTRYSLTQEDIVLMNNKIYTEDIIQKKVDSELFFKYEEANFNNMTYDEKTEFIETVRTPLYNEIKKELLNSNEATTATIDTEELYPTDKGSLLTLDEKGKAVDILRTYAEKRKALALNSNFINNVNPINPNIFEVDLEGLSHLEPMTSEELQECLNKGVSGIYMYNGDFMEYLVDTIPESNVYLQGENVDDLYEKYNGFTTGSLVSGIAIRISKKVGYENQIVELAYIPEIVGKLAEFKR